MQIRYEFKVAYAEARAWEFVNECGKRGLNYHVSVGGLDSITLFIFLRKIGMKQKAVAKKSGFEGQEFSNMMNGRKAIMAEYIPRIAKALNVTPNEIYESRTA